MAVATAKNRACSENCGIPVKKAARLQPIAARTETGNHAADDRLYDADPTFGILSLTLFAHSAAAKQPPNMPMIIIPSMRVSGVPSR